MSSDTSEPRVHVVLFKDRLKELEADLHGDLAMVANRVYTAREHMAREDYDDADVELGELLAHLYAQLRRLDSDA